jgi:hypothetical protein
MNDTVAASHGGADARSVSDIALLVAWSEEVQPNDIHASLGEGRANRVPNQAL